MWEWFNPVHNEDISIWDQNDSVMPFFDELNPNWNPPSEELDDGWDDADTVNENIYCPNPQLWIMEFCDEQENPGPDESDFEDAYDSMREQDRRILDDLEAQEDAMREQDRRILDDM